MIVLNGEGGARRRYSISLAVFGFGWRYSVRLAVFGWRCSVGGLVVFSVVRITFVAVFGWRYSVAVFGWRYVVWCTIMRVRFTTEDGSFLLCVRL